MYDSVAETGRAYWGVRRGDTTDGDGKASWRRRYLAPETRIRVSQVSECPRKRIHKSPREKESLLHLRIPNKGKVKVRMGVSDG